jgi:hypothetical protein
MVLEVVLPILVTARSEAGLGRLDAETVVSNPVYGMDVCPIHRHLLVNLSSTLFILGTEKAS